MHTDIATIAAGRNDDLLAFADAVTAYMSTEGATIDSLREVVNGAVTPTIAPARKARKQAPTMPAQDWRKRPASRKQVARIVALAEKVGKHTMRNTKTGERMPIDAENVATMTAGGASKLYQALKGLTVNNRHAEGITWDSDGRDDSGYAEGDDTSRWIERIERSFA